MSGLLSYFYTPSEPVKTLPKQREIVYGWIAEVEFWEECYVTMKNKNYKIKKEHPKYNDLLTTVTKAQTENSYCAVYQDDDVIDEVIVLTPIKEDYQIRELSLTPEAIRVYFYNKVIALGTLRSITLSKNHTFIPYLKLGKIVTVEYFEHLSHFRIYKVTNATFENKVKMENLTVSRLKASAFGTRELQFLEMPDTWFILESNLQEMAIGQKLTIESCYCRVLRSNLIISYNVLT